MRRDIGDGHRPVRRTEAEHARPHPAFQEEPAAVLQRIGEQAIDRAGEGQLQRPQGIVRSQAQHLAEPGVERLDVDRVAGADEALEHGPALGHDLCGVRYGRR